MTQTTSRAADEREAHDFAAMQERWLPVWDERAPFRSFGRSL